MLARRSLSRLSPLLALAPLVALASASACGAAEPSELFTPDPDGGALADGSAPEPDGGIVVPPGCDAAKDPKDQPECLNDAFAVFVSPAGADTAAGTKAAPVKTFAKALTLAQGGRSRVYACEGTFAENVVLDRSLSLYGGFVCATWAPGTGATVVAPPAGYALDLVKVTGVDVQDITFKAANGTAAAPSSIAVRVVGSKDVRFTRVDIEAGSGAAGGAGGAGATGAYAAGDGNGSSASEGIAGPAKLCTCTGGASTNGGGGGSSIVAPTSGGPAVAENPAGSTGAAGANATACAAGGFGKEGATAANASFAAAIPALGAVTDSAWSPARAPSGAAGPVGQGGGGGGSGLTNTGFGSGGGCGGCGGTGGQGGNGGGASIGVLLVDSTASLVQARAIATGGGAGGRGGAAGAGSVGGQAGDQVRGCQAGSGGRGGDGGAGAGGAGGISAAILFQGTKPTVDSGSTLVAGEPGAGGTGGAAGENDGPNGKAGTLLDVATL